MKILVLMLLIRGGQKDFEEDAPEWLDVALRWNADHLSRYGHTFRIERFQAVPPSKWDPPTSVCPQSPEGDRARCIAASQRDSATWMKFVILLEHLERQSADFILVIDADAIIVHPYHDTLSLMVSTMLAANKVMMLADEDWKVRGNTAVINTGVILAKQCNWTTEFFKHILQKRASGFCKSNEQLCLNHYHRSNLLNFRNRTHVVSGSVWNRHPRIGPLAADGEILHCMGGAKGVLPTLDLTHCGRCPCIHGICALRGARGACLDVDYCAARRDRQRGPFAVAALRSLQSTSMFRFGKAEMEELAAAAQASGASPIVIIPDGAPVPLRDSEKALLKGMGIEVIKADVRSPALLGLSVFGLVQFAAVVTISSGVRLSGANFTRILACATTGGLAGRFLSSAGPDFPLNGQIFAVRPDKALEAAVARFHTMAPFSDETGWDGAGWHPAHTGPTHRLSGLLWTVMHANGVDKPTPTALDAFEEESAVPPRAMQVDPSEWGVSIAGVSPHAPPSRRGCNGVDTRVVVDRNVSP
mmetsp:Transcript_3083/g.7370  ORF Transcript_3083/g.7370 Transcript_3083/m.7370 type:complete len:530 (-) Transcript_3083:43-1632(-)